MQYFVSGATGIIRKRLVKKLLAQTGCVVDMVDRDCFVKLLIEN